MLPARKNIQLDVKLSTKFQTLQATKKTALDGIFFTFLQLTLDVVYFDCLVPYSLFYAHKFTEAIS
jgi:hypothetical protein